MKKLVVTSPIEDEIYCFDINKVQIIDKRTEIVSLPYSNEYIQGIANIRGEILPVLSFRKLLDLDFVDENNSSRILIFNENGFKFGLAVDSIKEILDVSDYQETVLSKDKQKRFINKVYKKEEQLLLIVSIENIVKNAFEINEESFKSLSISGNVQKEKIKINFKKYITFIINNEEYAFDLLSVREIIKVKKFILIPDESKILKGIISLRDSILPVIDLKKYLNTGVDEITEKSRIIVIDIKGILLGLLVDEVKEVLSLEEEKLQNVPEIVSYALKQKINNVINFDNGKRLVMVFNTEKLFSKEMMENFEIAANKHRIQNDENKSKLNREVNKIKKFLIFAINSQLFAIDILNIIEINRIKKIVEVFELPKYVKGIVNLRGEVIPVVDFKRLFFDKDSNINDKSRLLILKKDENKIAFLVDYVKEVMNVEDGNIDEGYFKQLDNENKMFKSVIKFNNSSELIIILNEEKLKNIDIEKISQNNTINEDVQKVFNKDSKENKNYKDNDSKTLNQVEKNLVKTEDNSNSTLINKYKEKNNSSISITENKVNRFDDLKQNENPKKLIRK